MEKGDSSNAAAFVGAGDEEKQLEEMHETEAHKVAWLQELLVFGKAAHAEAMQYSDMDEEEVVKEYRRTGRLHTYDMYKELKKRFARVAKLHQWPWDTQMAAEVVEYSYYLEEDEDDFHIGLCSLIRE